MMDFLRCHPSTTALPDKVAERPVGITPIHSIPQSVPVFGGRKQYVALTKTEPLGCRASVTVADPAKDGDARKIVDSLRAAK